MVSCRQYFERARAVLAAVLVLHMLVIAAAAVGSRLHGDLHEDAEHPEHQCAITLFASGACHDVPTAVVAPAPAQLPISDEVAIERPRIASSFRFSGILEHAPPARD